MKTYIRREAWPKHVANRLPFGMRRLLYSRHAQTRLKERELTPPKEINMDNAIVYEAECPQKGVVSKIMLRFDYDGQNDMIMAAIPQRGGLFIKTAWWIQKDRQVHKFQSA